MKKYESITSGAPEKLGRRVAKSGARKSFTNKKRTASGATTDPLFCNLTYRDYVRTKYGRGDNISNFIEELLQDRDFVKKAVHLEATREEQVKKSCTMYLTPETAAHIRAYSEMNALDLSIMLRYIAWKWRWYGL